MITIGDRLRNRFCNRNRVQNKYTSLVIEYNFETKKIVKKYKQMFKFTDYWNLL